MKKILMIFIDGFGLLSPTSADHPIKPGRYPHLCELLSNALPLDARLEMPGLPQSATGQTTLYTGVNAAKAMERHIEGFPPERLKNLIREDNIFKRLTEAGKACTFANCYWLDDISTLPARKQSVTTVMTLSALGRVRGKKELLEGKAVQHDVTRLHMHERGYHGPTIPPEEAASHLINIASEHHLTLFEYFLTDRAGHARDRQHAYDALDVLERFLPAAAAFAETRDQWLVITSDHGNIEDLSCYTHTFNPVPLIALGNGAAEQLSHLRSLTDVTPALLSAILN